MLAFYGDISGSPSDQRAVIAAGGWLATESGWRLFSDDWRGVLQEAKAPAFHATDFHAKKRDFKWLKSHPKKHRRLSRDFCDVATGHPALGIAYAVKAGEEFDQTLGKAFDGFWTPHKRMTPKMLASTYVLARLVWEADRAGWLQEGEQISVHWEGEHGIGEAIDYWRGLRKRGEPWTTKCASFGTVEKCSEPAQAADLLVYEARHWARSNYGLRSDPIDRPELQRLKSSEKLLWVNPKAHKFQDVAERMIAYSKKHRGGLHPSLPPYRGKLPIDDQASGS